MLLLLSTSDTDLLSARAANAAGAPVPFRFANPARLPLDGLPALLDGADLVVVRLLGGLRAWQEGIDALLASGNPLVVLTGEQAPDAQLMEASTVPIGIAAEAHAYLAHGGPANLDQLARFLSDTVLLTGHGFEPPAPAPTWGHLERSAAASPGGPGHRGALLPRAPHERQHRLRGRPVRRDRDGGRAPAAAVRGVAAQPGARLLETLRSADALVTTVLAAGGTRPAGASAGEDDESWDAGALAGLGRADPPGAVPDGLAGRLGGQRRGPVAARRGRADSRPRVRRAADHGAVLVQGDRRGRPAVVRRRHRTRGAASRGSPYGTRACGTYPNADKRLALVLSAYPTKHSRIGNAVGLDTPASAVALLRRLVAEGYDFGRTDGLDDDPATGDPAAPVGTGGHAARPRRHPPPRRPRPGLRRRRRTDPRAHRRGRPRPGVADRRAVGTQPRTHPGRRLPPLVRPAPRRTARVASRSTGARRPARCSWTAAATRRATSSSRRCAAATC